MLDHLFGRPSSNFKRMEVLALVFVSWQYLKRNEGRIPAILRPIDSLLSRYRPWQLVLITLLIKTIASNLSLLTWLNAPEVYARLYNRNFYRATWIMTALDAGFFTAFNIRPAPVRHVVELLSSVYYLLNADAAEDKVRKIRSSNFTVDKMRVSWGKATSPLLWLITAPFRPKIGHVKELHVKRLSEVSNVYTNWCPTTRVKVYYAGSEEELKTVYNLLLHFPGGGFVCMSPENHEEVLRRWALQLGKKVAVISVDYGKCPEYPYPYALEECFELYKNICQTNGHCVGLNLASLQSPSTSDTQSVEQQPYYRKLRIALSGDSAGGNLAVSTTMKIILALREVDSKPVRMPPLQLQFTSAGQQAFKKSNQEPMLWKPEGLLIVYGCLNFDMASWIAPVEKKNSNNMRSSGIEQFSGINVPYLSLTSRMSFFNDRIITPELQRAMALLYLGTSTTVNPATDMFLSPVNAPEDVLCQFPRIWMMCGECDPFVDDTVIFAARVRHAVANKMAADMEASGGDTDAESDATHGRSPALKPEVQNLASYFDLNKLAASPTDPVPTSPTSKWIPRIITRLFYGLEDSEQESNSTLAQTLLETTSSDEEDSVDEDELYGNVTRDSTSHVTVKIYSGLSHAFLQMIAFLPESRHAINLCGDWIIEMFESSQEARIRRRKRRQLRRTARYTSMKSPLMIAEMRDEDNIPTTIDLPLGAEYRVGGSQIRLRRDSEMVAQTMPKKLVGYFSDTETSGADKANLFSNNTISAGYRNPLSDAMNNTKSQVHKGLKGGKKSKPLSRKSSNGQLTPVELLFTQPEGQVVNQKAQEQKKAPRSVSKSVSQKQLPAEDMFMSEYDVVSKRRNVIVRDVYSGVPPEVSGYEDESVYDQAVSTSLQDLQPHDN